MCLCNVTKNEERVEEKNLQIGASKTPIESDTATLRNLNTMKTVAVQDDMEEERMLNIFDRFKSFLTAKGVQEDSKLTTILRKDPKSTRSRLKPPKSILFRMRGSSGVYFTGNPKYIYFMIFVVVIAFLVILVKKSA
ncbi:unnamed protein product [Peronospora effusa]|nr:unnamed protein product [Peronospora effusa]